MANLLNRLDPNHTPHPRHSNPHSARRTTHVSLPAVSSLGGLRTPAPCPRRHRHGAGIRKPSQKQTLRRVRARSVHTRIADVALLHRHVRFVPRAEVRHNTVRRAGTAQCALHAINSIGAIVPVEILSIMFLIWSCRLSPISVCKPSGAGVLAACARDRRSLKYASAKSFRFRSDRISNPAPSSARLYRSAGASALDSIVVAHGRG
jgi:hypothetical protein